MTRNEKFVVLAAVVVGGVFLQKCGSKLAKDLGVPSLALAAATWVLSEAL